MKGFVFIAIGLALIYVAFTGKAADLIVAVLTGKANKPTGTTIQ
jgi:hypothetical protein